MFIHHEKAKAKRNLNPFFSLSSEKYVAEKTVTRDAQ